ncbi:MAG: helix-turn-helix domain-containing protein [Clostridia bacterium]|nr:helix-turn-helix domain-containing protein [Clostridia bacterium]
MEKNYYTVEEAAGKIGVHTKTIRRYIYSGKLSAKKIAGQWRVSDEALEEYLNGSGSCCSGGSSGVSKDDFCVFMDNDYFGSEDAIQVCTIVDYYVEEQKEVAPLAADVMMAVTTLDDTGKSKFNYVYDDSEKKARFVFWGSPGFIEALMKTIKRYV